MYKHFTLSPMPELITAFDGKRWIKSKLIDLTTLAHDAKNKIATYDEQTTVTESLAMLPDAALVAYWLMPDARLRGRAFDTGKTLAQLDTYSDELTRAARDHYDGIEGDTNELTEKFVTALRDSQKLRRRLTEIKSAKKAIELERAAIVAWLDSYIANCELRLSY